MMLFKKKKIRGDIELLPEKSGENIFKENVKCCFFWTTLERGFIILDFKIISMYRELQPVISP